MRLNKYFYRNIRLTGFLVICFLTFLNVSGQDQKIKRERQLVNITLKVLDDTGSPVGKADVVIGEGVLHLQTDANGSVSFRAYPEDFVTVISEGLEKSVTQVTEIIQNGTIKLTRSKLFMTSDDVVPLPFATPKKRNITGPEITIDAARLGKYPSNDIRNGLSGLTSQLDVRELYGWPGISTQEHLGSFGATDKFTNIPVAIIDGIYCDLTEVALDPSEIESITLNKGLLAAGMFGPVTAKRGFLYIKTRRGAKNEKTLNVNVETGVSTIDRMPGWVSGTDYAKLNNQARTNENLTPLYSNDAISQYSKNDPYNMVYPSINFRELMLKNSMGFRRVNFSASGGNEIVQYYSYIGYNGEGDIYKIGAKSDYNRISTRQNVDVRINDVFSVNVGFYGNISIRRSPNYGYSATFSDEGSSTNTSLSLMEMPSVLGDITTISPVAFPIWAKYDSINKIPWYGVSSNFSDNPIGGLVGQGYYSETGRLGASNVALNFDMGKAIKGLKSTTFFGFNIFNLVRLGKVEDYMAYTVTPSLSPSTGNDTILLTKSSAHNLALQTDESRLMDYYYQRYGFYENLQYDRIFGNHGIQSNLTYYRGITFRNGIEEPERQQNGIWHLLYSFKDRYSAELLLNYAGTYSFDRGKKYRLFPSAGLSWVISDENFFPKGNFINYIKLRAQAGTLGVETFLSPFYYMDRWSQNSSGSAFGPVSANQWFGSSTDASVRRTSIQRIGNRDLSWEILKEVNGGIDALLFNKRLLVEITYSHFIDKGMISQPYYTIPYVTGISGGRPWDNYNSTKGDILGIDLKFTHKIGQVELTLGGNATTWKETRTKYDELNYRFDYQKRTGKPVDAIFGMEYIGKFSSDDEALIIPQRFDEVLHKGDLKYADLNNDGIVDDNDAKMIGNSSPRLIYGLSASLRYKGFEFFVYGAGRAFYDLMLSNPYYWNGWGDGNYSNFVKDNLGGAYPRLTYYRVNNNFLGSKFWLTRGDYFKIQNMEIAYTIPANMLQFMGSRGIRLFLRGANLLTLSKVKDVDPESINSGIYNYPLFKTFSGGIKFNF